MKQTLAQTSTIKLVGTAIVALTLSFAASLFVAAAANAHEVGNVVGEGKANCYGKIASMHAKEGKGIKASYAEWNHVAVPDLANDATFQEEVAAIKAYCREG